MPFNPLDLLKRGWQAANTPIIDEETIQPYQDMVDSPSLERSPMEARMRGFGAGAMEGMRQLATPLNMGMMAAGPAIGMMRGAKAASKVINPGFDLIEANPVAQITPAMDDVNALIGDLQRNLAKIPKRRPQMETLGEGMAEFTPKGGEGMYNAGKGAPQRLPTDIMDMLRPGMGGRGQ